MKSITKLFIRTTFSTLFVLATCACAPITIQIGSAVPTATSTPTRILTATATITATTTVTATVVPDTPTPTATSAQPQLPVTGVISLPPQPPQIVVISPPQSDRRDPPRPPQEHEPQQTGPRTPSQPGNFDADGAGTTITFRWEDMSANENGFRIYQVGRSAPVVSLPSHNGTGGMSYSWKGQPCNLSASFFIRAFNDGGESPSSNTETAVTVPCVLSDFKSNSLGNTISFIWDVATTHNESGFRIYEQGVSVPVATRGPSSSSGSTSFDWGGRPCNLIGSFSVRAFNSAGESSDSNKSQAESIPCGPTGLSVTGASKTTITLAWTDNGTNETGFHIYRDDVLALALPAHNDNSPMTADVGQPCGESHAYYVRAFNDAGESIPSAHLNGTTLPCSP
jgi:hypothetical protein